MALERKDIERTDFPTARRGYAREAVDAHLRKVADEVQTLGRSENKPADSLAAGASEQVRQIVAAAEASAADIRAEAEREAKGAAAEGREHVERVATASRALVERIEAMEAELRSLVEGLEGELGGTARAVSAPVRLPPAEEDHVVARPVDAAPDEESEPEPEPESAKANQGGDSEGARLIALNMALNGSPREETDRYLAEHFDLDDRSRMLDEVYARVAR